MDREAKWICPAADTGDVAPVFSRGFTLSGTVREASLTITALGVYEAELNGQRVGQFILTPAGQITNTGCNTRPTTSRSFWQITTGLPFWWARADIAAAWAGPMPHTAAICGKAPPAKVYVANQLPRTLFLHGDHFFGGDSGFQFFPHLISRHGLIGFKTHNRFV